MSIAKRWCFTINNPTDADKFWCVDGDEDHPNDVMVNVEYLILQEERGENGTLHWQGFLILKKKEKLTWLKRRLNARAHWEVARGTNQQAAEYCRKDDTYTGGLRHEFGKMPERAAAPKASERLAEAAEELDVVKEGYKRPREIKSMTLLQCGFMTAYNALTADILGPTREGMQVVTLVGPPGTGKSYCINKLFPKHGRCIYGNNGVWFQNPTEDVMIFEEFSGTTSSKALTIERMKCLLDIYPMALEVKGGMRPAMYTKVFITSNTPPNAWYKVEDIQGNTIEAKLNSLHALWDRLGYSNGSYVPVRTTGTYLQAPLGLSIDDTRKWFMTEVMKALNIAEPISDDEDDEDDTN